MKNRGSKTKVIKVKARAPQKSAAAPETKKLYSCTFQKMHYQIDSPVPNEACAICGLGTKRPFPDLKGQVAFHTCYAQICLECLQRCLEQQFKLGITSLFCPICLHVFNDSQRAQVHPDINNQISERLTLSKLDNVVDCKFCSNRYIFEPVSTSEVNSEYNGRKLNDAQILCAAQNAVTCNECLISSCQHCGAVPYHLGETCEEHMWWVEGCVCRICSRAAEPKEGKEVALLNCGHPDCLKIANRMCEHIHACGHACVGIRGEAKHPPCPECTDGGSLCSYCDKELWGSLCLSMECGHTIHLSCALEIIRRPRSGPELKLPLCPAVGCGEFIKHEVLKMEEERDYSEWLQMEHQIDRIAGQRVLAEGIEFHPEVASKSSPFSQHGDKAALNWAKKKLRFMICSHHTHPVIYTSGRIDDPPLADVSCPNCNRYPYPNCPKHGFNYMQFKCDCCCSIGVRRGRSSQDSSMFVWLCEICFDMPGRADIASHAACKGNCRFAPHPKSRNEFYGRCQKCGYIKSVTRTKSAINRQWPASNAKPIQSGTKNGDKNSYQKKT